MTRQFTLDVYFNTEPNSIPLAVRKADITRLMTERTFPVYGTFGNSLNKRTLGNFNLSMDSVDFKIDSLDCDTEKAEITWLNNSHVPQSLDGVNLCLSYYADPANTRIVELRYGFLQQKIEHSYQGYVIAPPDADSELFDFPVALRLLLEGKPLTRDSWRWDDSKFISHSPKTDNLPQERFWSPCNAAAVGMSDNKTGNVKDSITFYNSGSIETYTPTMDDLFANDWRINNTIWNAMNNRVQLPETINTTEISTIHSESTVKVDCKKD